MPNFLWGCIVLALVSLCFGAPEVIVNQTSIIGTTIDTIDSFLVMVWLYGGSFTTGDASPYDASEIISVSMERGTPIVYATFNYRLGPLGFPLVSGNYLIKQNIGAFEGSPDKVTLFGESAGAFSLATFLTNDKINGLARAMIIQSSPGQARFHPQRGDSIWKEYVDAIPSCTSMSNTSSTLDCVRQADSASVIAALDVTTPAAFVPAIDGPGGFIPDRPSKVGHRSKIPVIIGSNRDEGTLFVIPQSISSDDEIRQFVLDRVSPPLTTEEEQMKIMNEILELYPDVPALGSPFGTGNETFGLDSQYKRLAALYGDLMFTSYRRTITEKLSAQDTKVWGYSFADAFATYPDLGPEPSAPGSLGVTHGSELAYVFGGLIEPANSTESSWYLSRVMREYWISFAVSLDPNDGLGTPRPIWKAYTRRSPMVMQLNGTSSRLIRDDYRSRGVSFFQHNPDFLHI